MTQRWAITMAASRASALLLCVVVGAGFRAACQETKPRLSPDAIRRIEQAIDSFRSRRGIPGMSVAVVADAELVWAGGFGQSDLEHEVSAKAQTAYRTASIGKTMTATAAMRLVEAGRLDLDADIRKYCPAFPAKAWPITAGHLLAHTSGIRHYGGPRDRAEQLSTEHYASVVDALAVFKNDSLLFRPGSRYQYSTYGYNVLGCVIEGAAGERFMAYMTRVVFEPSGMRSTRDDDPATIIPGRARGYRREPNGELRNSYWVDMSSKLPAGGYITTVEDLARFAIALLRGTIIREETWKRMMVPPTGPDGKPLDSGYGLGWGVDAGVRGPELYHGGQTPQVSGMLEILPDRRFAVAMLMNLEGVSDRRELTRAIAEIVLGSP